MTKATKLDKEIQEGLYDPRATSLKVGDIVTRTYADGTQRRLKIIGINNRGNYNQLVVVRVNKSGIRRIRNVSSPYELAFGENGIYNGQKINRDRDGEIHMGHNPVFWGMRETGTLRGYDPKTSSVPSRWYEAMVKGIKRSSDVRNPYAIVKSIWAKLSPSKRVEIKAREKKGEQFKYDLPLPVDKPTRGVGTVRMVKPFKLAEVQVNLSVKDYLSALKSGLFSKMKRQDGTTALVARCKSPEKNVNVFVDKARN